MIDSNINPHEVAIEELLNKLKDLEKRVKKLENKVYEIKEENKNWKYGDK